jgi:hypothetical protein
MPLVAFKPTKARLIIEQSKDSVLVMKIAAAADERLALKTGGSLSAATGVLRVREQKPHLDRLDRKVSGSLVFIDDSPRVKSGGGKYQINIAMGSKKFESLLQVALAGRLPTKFFIDAGERSGPFGSRGIIYETSRNGRVKVWNNRSHPVLPIANFSMILPIDVPEAEPPPPDETRQQSMPEGLATSAQVAELADELLAFQAETHYTLKAIVTIIGVILLLAVVFNVVLLYR